VTVHLLDVNVLIALARPQHIHHGEAHTWFDKVGRRAWSTCPISELGFIRISSNPKIIRDAVGPRDAVGLDAYLLALAQHHKGKLATLDGGLSELIQAPKDRSRHVSVIM